MLSQPTRQRRRSTPDGFWSRVDQSAGPEACWPWKLRCNADGYGAVTWCWVETGTHRVAYSLARGPIAAGMVVMHACDSRKCCNPSHLSLGTSADNNADMRAKGRDRTSTGDATRGVLNHNAKLTDDAVRELRAAWRAGESIKSIVARTGLAVGTVHPMLYGRTWRHVTEAA